MPRIADFAVITDTKFSINNLPGGDSDREFDFTLDGPHVGSRSVLYFVLFVLDGCGFQVSINGHPQLNYQFSGRTVITLHEVIGSNVLKAGTNSIEFKIISGLGKLEFGDAVLFYQRDI